MGSKTDRRSGQLSRRRVNKTSRDRVMRTWLLSATSAVALILVGLLGYGIVEKYWIVPQKAVATVGEYEITLELLQQHTRYRRMQMLNQYISYLDLLKYAGDQRNQVQDLLDQIDKELQDPVMLTRSIMDELVNMHLILEESRARNIAIDEAEIETAIKIYFGYESGANDTSSDSVDNIVATQSPVATPYSREAYEENYRTYLDEINVDAGMSESVFRSLFASKLRTEKLRKVIGSEQELLEEEQVYVKHILLSLDNLDAAVGVLAQALEGEDFDKLALEFSDDVSNADTGGDLGWVNENSISERLKSKIINTPIGNVSEPILLPEGIFFFKVRDKRKSEKVMNIEDIKNQLVDTEKNKILHMHSLSHYDNLRRTISVKYY